MYRRIREISWKGWYVMACCQYYGGCLDYMDWHWLFLFRWFFFEMPSSLISSTVEFEVECGIISEGNWDEVDVDLRYRVKWVV